MSIKKIILKILGYVWDWAKKKLETIEADEKKNEKEEN